MKISRLCSNYSVMVFVALVLQALTIVIIVELKGILFTPTNKSTFRIQHGTRDNGNYLVPSKTDEEHFPGKGQIRMGIPLTVGKQKCPKAGDISDWTFQCTYVCPDIDMNRTGQNRVQLVPVCSQNTGKIKTESTDMESVPVLKFNQSCLSFLLKDNCFSKLPVPNIVHFVWYGMREMKFYHFLSVYSAYKIQKPCLILIHGDFLPSGDYWEFLVRLVPIILFIQQVPPTEIAGEKILHIEHKADITRLLVLKEYGGIYMDTDEVLLRSLDPLRRHNFTLSRAFNFNLSNGMILSARNASFLNIWIQAYDSYDPKKWGFHSTIMPFKLSKLYPSLIHIENKTFVRPDAGHIKQLFNENFNWSENYGIHLFMRYFKSVYDIRSFRTMNVTIGSVARFVLFGQKEVCAE